MTFRPCDPAIVPPFRAVNQDGSISVLFVTPKDSKGDTTRPAWALFPNEAHPEGGGYWYAMLTDSGNVVFYKHRTAEAINIRKGFKPARPIQYLPLRDVLMAKLKPATLRIVPRITDEMIEVWRCVAALSRDSVSSS